MGVNGLPTLADLARGGAQPKPAKGTAHLARRKDQADTRQKERTEKSKVRKRDGGNRWPGKPNPGERLEVAHFKGKGMGGDHGLRSTSENLIQFDWLTHQGPRSLHSGHLKVVPLTRAICNGPVSFWEREGLPGGRYGRWRCVGRETAVGVLERLP